jgi:mono/diheme cytochrome c family protein/glucose/arabinose dehydrogenase
MVYLEAMFLSRVRAAALLLVMAVLTASGQQSSPVNRPWPPGVQKVSPESPALSPADALQTFYMPPGYRIELVAAEPLIQDPIVIDWDRQGRLWAVEMPGFVPNLTAPEPNMSPVGRVVVLEDTNKDGAMDKRTVFADGLVLPRAIKVLDRGVLVGEPPNAWLMRDTNGDLKMDEKESITDLYGRREARVEQNTNDFYWAMDNWMHTANGDIILRLKNGKFEVRRTPLRGEWGVTQDDAGRIYRNTNESSVHVDYVPTPYFMRNPALVRTRGSYEEVRDDEGAVNTVWPVRPNPGTNRAYQAGIDRPDGTLARFTSVCAPLIYRGDRLPADVYGNMFVAEPAANLVSRIVLQDSGKGLTARKAYERGEFLASSDERFRPVYLANAPDGTLYIVDMYRGVIQQRADITEYLRDHITSHKLEEPNGLGRIYRVMHETTRRDTSSAAVQLSSAQLVDRLSHPNGWWRDAAQRLLVERGDKSVAPALVKLANGAKDWRTRVHALWTLDGLDAIEPAVAVAAVDDPAREVRAAAIRIAERWLADNRTVQAAVLKHVDDTEWPVRHQLAATLGVLPADVRDPAMVKLLEQSGDDAITVDAALSGLRGGELAVLERLLQAAAGTTPPREAAATMIAATIARGAQDGAVQKLLSLVGDEARPAWQRAAVLRGAEVAVLGAAPPGTPARRGGPALADAPCSTCPGGRAGPGGAYAFPQAARPPAARQPPVRINAEPTAFTALAAKGGELGARAAKLLDRIEWPGKPGAAAAVAPLSASEQQRFAAGQEVYGNVCQACHQPDGRGLERVAPPLVGSAFALATPEVPIRILLHGKEGSVGLMPPVGQVFTDEQIASVLTYVRREWGQGASPVEPATVGSVRTATKGRSRPWTEAELTALAGQK